MFRTYSTVIIVRVPSKKIPVFIVQHRPERDRHSILNNHTFILLYWMIISKPVFLIPEVIIKQKSYRPINICKTAYSSQECVKTGIFD